MSEIIPGSTRPSNGARIALLSLGLALVLGAAARRVLTDVSPSPEERVAALVDLMVKGHGGAEALRSVHALRMEGRITTSAGAEGSFARVSRGPGELASLTDYVDRMEIRILTGGQGWRGDTHDALAPADGPLLMAMNMQSARLLAPWILDRYRERAVLLEDGDAGPLLGLDLGDGSELRMRLDPVTHRVAWTGSFIPVGGMTMEFTTSYSDFRRVGDVVLAYREENTAQRVPTATLVLDDLTLNPAGEDLRLMNASKITGGDPSMS